MLTTFPLRLGHNSCRVNVLGEDDSTQPGEIVLNVDPNNKEKLVEAAIAALRATYWHLDREFDYDPIRQHFMLHVAPGVTVTLTVFGRDRHIEYAQVDEICHALAQVWSGLRDKRHWRLRSIQVPPYDKPNTKSGLPLFGSELPTENRFLIMPAALRMTGDYRGQLPCSWLTGVTIHEATHVCLEWPLQDAWIDAGGLGWATVSNALIRYPGGDECKYVNLHPDRCPTPYAAYSHGDDRAESVVALLSGGPLDEARQRAVETAIIRQPHVGGWRVEELPLPTFDNTLTVRCQPTPPGQVLFRGRGVSGGSLPLPIYSLDSFHAHYAANPSVFSIRLDTAG